MLVSVHEGLAAGSTQNFEDFVGKSDWNEHILGQWDKFLHAVYREFYVYFT